MSKPPLEFTEGNLLNIKSIFYAKAGIEEIQPTKKHRKKFYSIAMVATISLLLVTSAAGMGVIDLSFLSKFIEKDMVRFLQPVSQVSEDQGIKMETLAAVSDDEMAAIYFNMTDLTGNRIDDKLDIYDYSAKGVTTHNAQLIHYDEATKTATMRMLVNGGKKLNGNKITVRIDSFLSGAMTEKEYNPGFDLYSLLNDKPASGTTFLNRQKDDISGLGGEGIEEIWEQEEIAVLEKDKIHMSLPGMDWQYISNIGFVDGKLHIQVNPESDMGRFNHGYFYFTDLNGNRQDIARYSISYGAYEIDQVGMGGDYIEYVYDIADISQLKDLKLRGYFTTYTDYFQGKWKTSFVMEGTTNTKQASVNIKLAEAVITNVEVSTLGITLEGKGLNEIGSSDDNIAIHYKDGSVIHSESIISSSSERVKLLYPKVIQIENVDFVTINGQEIQLQ
ncbi:hypothetical protein [Paenibacillus glacialis]|uniref:DUF4179 domain-containing protein n=1 Tax=Paenibacillus glacialis TaxID=494026 RepID=A0A168MM16_9BACL|nr:hypothetical protein [Paenibacillus glacialis]OAB44831.1 hypothetical protein PGLA_05325 [Paenibacillus glacialis]